MKYTAFALIPAVLFVSRVAAEDSTDDGDNVIDEIIQGIGKGVDKVTSGAVSVFEHATSKIVDEAHDFASDGKSVVDRVKSDFNNGKNGDDSSEAKPTGVSEEDSKSDDGSGAGKATSMAVAAIAVAAVAQLF